MELRKSIYDIGRKAKEASYKLAILDTDIKNRILKSMAKAILKNAKLILKANEKDVLSAKKSKKTNAVIDRLSLNESRIKSMAAILEEVASLEDPVGSIENIIRRPNGLMIGKIIVPIGVIGIIYEARPNVTSDCIALCLKSGNSVILRGGSEALNSNAAIFRIINKAAMSGGLPKGAVNLIEYADRKAVDILLGMTGIIDLIMPRGGESLINEVVKKAKVPIIKHYKGVCHVYVDEYADLNMAEKIAFNAKVQRPGVCNAMEALLVHKDVALRFLPSMIKKFKNAGVEIRGCNQSIKIVKGIEKAREFDWYKEYLDLILNLRIVNSIDEAIAHIRKYGSMHSDAIVTENYEHGMKFIKEVDSACVYINASTRFTDGHEFGKSAEIGISTDKIHARGPMGVKELTSYKYAVFGNGQIRT